ncbi:MbtH family protein [Pseudonocardia xinjiangensis]|uniref:MbtH family protein n=1 Tax=Pseudonocardia xinjiangensis TaxID=75289 RepID=UPI003D8C115B
MNVNDDRKCPGGYRLLDRFRIECSSVAVTTRPNGSPFDDEPLSYVVVVNRENQHSLWPDLVEIPDGWSLVFGPAGREDCLTYVDRSWTDMRPKSLVDEMGS